MSDHKSGFGDHPSGRNFELDAGADRTRECPLCGETMRIKVREMVDRIPGQPQVVRRAVREWTCPECDFFEDVLDDRAPA